MTYEIPIYKAEKEAGLEQIIKSKSSIVFACQLNPADISFLSAKSLEFTKAFETNHMNLYPLTSLFVTAGIWNLNDDVFDRLEVWSARNTPQDQPINNGHDCSKIIGHITETHPINDKRERLAVDLCVDELPEKYHLITSGVVYKHYDQPDIQKEVDDLLKAITAGKKYVSMEALFKGFDYAIIDEKGNQHIVARSEESAFLTKHLRAYGGDGIYQNHKVGRLMRNIAFSGKGIVDNPGNKESVIFTNASPFLGTKRISTSEILQNLSNTVYINKSALDIIKESQVTDKEIQDLKDEVKKLQADLIKANDVSKIKDLEDQLADKVAKIGADAEQIKNFNEKIKVLEKSQSELEAVLAQVKSEKEKSDLELSNIKAEQKKTARLAILAKAVEDEKEAAELYENLNLASADDVKFASTAEYLTKKTAAYKVVNKEKKVADETAKKAAQTKADEDALAKAKVEETAKLNVSQESVEDEKVEKTRSEIWDYFTKNKNLRYGRKPKTEKVETSKGEK